MARNAELDWEHMIGEVFSLLEAAGVDLDSDAPRWILIALARDVCLGDPTQLTPAQADERFAAALATAEQFMPFAPRKRGRVPNRFERIRDQE